MTTVASWLYITNPSFPTPNLVSGHYIRVYRVGDIMTACIIVGTTQLTIATINLSAINTSLNRTFSFDTNYDVIPISLYGNTQFSRITMYALPILERITDRIPDSTVYTSWDQTYSSSNVVNYTAGSIVQDNNSLYVQTNLPNNSILDRTINVPVYESSFTVGTVGNLIGQSAENGIGKAAGFSSPAYISYGVVGGTRYLIIGEPSGIRFFNIASSAVTSLSSSIAPTACAPLTVCNNILYWYYASPGNTPGLYSLPLSDAIAGTGSPTLLVTGVPSEYSQAMTSDGQRYLYYVISSSVFLLLYQYDIVNNQVITPLLGFTDGMGIPTPDVYGITRPNNWSTPSFIARPTYFGMVYDTGTNNLYFCDTGRHSVQAFISTGVTGSFKDENNIFTVAGSGTAGYVDGFGVIAQFSSPSGLSITPSNSGSDPNDPRNGALFISDPGNNLIRSLFLADRNVATRAGQYQVSGFLDGLTGSYSTFGSPNSMFFVTDTNFMYVGDTEYNLLRRISRPFVTARVDTVAGNINVLFDLYANDKLTRKITNNGAIYQSGGGFRVSYDDTGQYLSSIKYYSAPEGSIFEFTPVQLDVWPYIEISASPGGYTYVRIKNTGAVYNNGSSTVTTPYSNSYVWASGDTIRVIKQVNNIYVQYIRNNIVTNVLGFDGNNPLYNSAGYQQDVIFTLGDGSASAAASITYLTEYALPAWDLLLTDASANVTENFSVAVGSGLNSIIYSSNGLSWFPVSGTQFSISGSRVAWDGSMWYAVGSGTSPILWSSNGTNWSSTGITYPAGFTGGTDIATNGKTWVAVGRSTTNPIIQSTSSLTWDAVSVDGLTRANAVASNGTSWVIGCTGSSHPIFYSPDGTNWSPLTSTNIFTVCNGVAANNSLWVAVGYGTNKLAYSPDGLVWTGVSSVFTSSGNGVAWNGNVWIAVGQGTTKHMYSSKNGISWTPITTGFGTSSIGRSIAWNGNVWIAAGTWYDSGNISIVSSIITSPDGSNWTIISGTPFTNNIANGCAARKPLSTTVNSTVSSKGFFTYTGDSPMIVNNSTVKTTSNIILTLSSASPSVPTTIPFVTGITAGTSFSVTGVSTDRSIYNYIIL
jgi:hypothetical protein